MIPDLPEDDEHELAPRIGHWCYHLGELLYVGEACATVYGH